MLFVDQSTSSTKCKSRTLAHQSNAVITELQKDSWRASYYVLYVLTSLGDSVTLTYCNQMLNTPRVL